MADDREGRDQHDDRHHDEEGELLELERGEEAPVHLHPVAHPVAKAELGGDLPADALGVERIRELDLDPGDSGEPRELLGHGQAQVGDRPVVFVHADLDRAGHRVAPHLRYHADGCHGALR